MRSSVVLGGWAVRGTSGSGPAWGVQKRPWIWSRVMLHRGTDERLQDYSGIRAWAEGALGCDTWAAAV